MSIRALPKLLPAWQSLVLAVAAAIMLILAFPDFDLWIFAWFALVPLLMAIDCEKQSNAKAFITGWFFGLIFFFGTCWWLTHAPITYAGFSPLLAYFLLFVVCSIVAVFPGIFAAIVAVLLRRFGPAAVLGAPFVWVATEFLRYWVTGNNWNALGYSQAWNSTAVGYASLGGVHLVSGVLVALNIAFGFFLYLLYRAYGINLAILFQNVRRMRQSKNAKQFSFGEQITNKTRNFFTVVMIAFVLTSIFCSPNSNNLLPSTKQDHYSLKDTQVIAIQPNVPMSGLSYEKWQELRERHVVLTEQALARLAAEKPESNGRPTIVIFPESPMNFQYTEDPEFRWFITEFSRKHNVSVLFNSAEPNHADGKYFNSAKMVGPDGRPVGQYDKIHLVPFGEFVPGPFEYVIPALVGSFSRGTEHTLLPLGEAKTGVMICFESHFGELSRQYALSGADVLVELTNDGYLGNTPVLRQHLANAVFRAVETKKPVLRVTNVGITAYISEYGEVLNPAPVYQNDTRIWSVSKSHTSQTFYVKYGDWFAWLCLAVTCALLGYAFFRRRQQTV